MYIQRFHTYQETVLEHESGVHTGQRQVWGIDRAERWNSEKFDLYPTLFLHTRTEREREWTQWCVCVCVCVCLCVLCVVCCVRVPMCVYFLCE